LNQYIQNIKSRDRLKLNENLDNYMKNMKNFQLDFRKNNTAGVGFASTSQLGAFTSPTSPLSRNKFGTG
jgi:hypothetical protein